MTVEERRVFFETVNAHMKHIMEKLSASDRTHAINHLLLFAMFFFTSSAIVRGYDHKHSLPIILNSVIGIAEV